MFKKFLLSRRAQKLSLTYFEKGIISNKHLKKILSKNEFYNRASTDDKTIMLDASKEIVKKYLLKYVQDNISSTDESSPNLYSTYTSNESKSPKKEAKLSELTNKDLEIINKFASFLLNFSVNNSLYLSPICTSITLTINAIAFSAIITSPQSFPQELYLPIALLNITTSLILYLNTKTKPIVDSISNNIFFIISFSSKTINSILKNQKKESEK